MWRSWALVPEEVPKFSVCVGSDQLGMGLFVGQLIPSLAGGGGGHSGYIHPMCCE